MAGKGGGAWKVAYADFVTAMMALFMVLWIMSQDTEILQATSRYFQNPFNSPLDRSTGLLDDGDEGVVQKEMSQELTTSVVNLGLLHEVAHEFYRMLDLEEREEERPVEVAVTEDGLRVTIYDSSRPIFHADSLEFTDWGDLVMRNLAWMVESYRLSVRIDSFCPKGDGNLGPNYGPFELTADRANAVRRALVFYALPSDRILQVSGRGDRSPLPNIPPDDPANQRVEVSLSLKNHY